MSDIQKTYDEMWVNAIQCIKDDKYEIDNLMNSSEDTRRGVSVLSYLSHPLGVAICELLDELKGIEPEQYYYPTNEFHLTILSIITCVEDFKLSDIDVKAYSDAFELAVKEIGPLKIRYSGVTASPSCILIQGFPDNDQLHFLRDKLRLSFKKANLHTTIDLRYKISTAHSTVVRFRAPLRKRDEFIDVLSKYRKTDFGTLKVDRLELVFNNWYQALSVTKPLSVCELRTTK
ncbi:MAG: 2'-5' RNA ligase [Psychromonas sp.]|jgi:2'-5' RNA ligase|uniref:2'-5' RNA ligase family protein n=1 Tax=Psychromonas sp. TaxID=1884585 RepID=UPI0039E2D2F9